MRARIDPRPPCFARYVISDPRLFCQSRNVNRLFAFCSAFDLVGDCLSLDERFESVLNDTREVNEDLFAVFADNESVALLAVEPFYFTCHKCLLLNVTGI